MPLPTQSLDPDLQSIDDDSEHSCLHKPSTGSPELDDLLAVAFSAPVASLRPRRLLRHRILAATDSQTARVVTDVDGGILSVSPPFCEMCGYSAEEIRGRKPGDFLQGPLTEPDAVETLRKAIASQESCEVEFWNYHKNGSPYRVKVRIDPVLSPSGKFEGYEALETCLQPAES